MDFYSISIKLRCAFGFPVSCLIDDHDGQIIARIFMVPEHLQEKVVNEIRDLESDLVPDEYLISVLPYSPEETLEYYPEMYQSQQEISKASHCEYTHESAPAKDRQCDTLIKTA